MVQIHKTFTDEQVRELMQRYTNQQITENISMNIMGHRLNKMESRLSVQRCRSVKGQDHRFLKYTIS